jgi:V/A-type H+-transporting ATPase subunit I
MSLRPAAARWFELLVPRDAVAGALAHLSTTGHVQLQACAPQAFGSMLEELRRVLDGQARLAQRFAGFWPDAEPTLLSGDAAAGAARALADLEGWAAGGELLVTELQQAQLDVENLRGLLTLATACGDRFDPRRLAAVGPLLVARAYLASAVGPLPQASGDVLVSSGDAGRDRFLLAVGPAEDMEGLDAAWAALKLTRLNLATGLDRGEGSAVDALARRLEAGEREVQRLRARLDALNESHGIARCLGALQCAAWLVANVPDLQETANFARITGWCSDRRGRSLRAALQEADIGHVLCFPPPPAGAEPPVLLANPPWARIFETFARLLGTPGKGEADPSVLVAILAPLMFGFMFGDVGQGAVLVAAGLLLRRHLPATALLVPGGLAAMLFGLLFGSTFALEHMMPPLWVRPMAEPLTLLATSLLIGVLVIATGLAIDALQYVWRGCGGLWWRERFGLVLGYLGLVLAPLEVHALWLPVAGVLVQAGAALRASRGAPLAALAGALGTAVETWFQLVANTISFVRIGAFALAHAGLNSVVEELAGGLHSAVPHVAALVAGNAVILALEGLVVGIQTTRLVLFEFFIRFLRTTGRAFIPLPEPVALAAALAQSRTSS